MKEIKNNINVILSGEGADKYRINIIYVLLDLKYK